MVMVSPKRITANSTPEEVLAHPIFTNPRPLSLRIQKAYFGFANAYAKGQNPEVNDFSKNLTDQERAEYEEHAHAYVILGSKAKEVY